ncbi:MAG: hypothetical protein IKD72_02740 [Clostridia bacterium]|nr:hypothetical protein [Clostridia bacterium]
MHTLTPLLFFIIKGNARKVNRAQTGKSRTASSLHPDKRWRKAAKRPQQTRRPDRGKQASLHLQKKFLKKIEHLY